MYFPYLIESESFTENTTVFGGLNRQISASESQFSDMKNMTSKYFPVLSPRQKRSFVKKFTNPQGILDKEELIWIDDGKLYVNDKEVSLHGVNITDRVPKTLSKMGAFVIIMPDKIWYNTATGESGYMGNSVDSTEKVVSFSLCDAMGNVISYNNAKHYETIQPEDGNYMMSTVNGKPSLKVYSAATKMWTTVASTYIKIEFSGAGIGFWADDGVQITVDSNQGLEYVFVNKDESDMFSTNTYIIDRTDNAITIPGIFSGTPKENVFVNIERKVPTLAFVTECSNRLWGCSADGREIYGSKLGDVKNWNVYKGISTDSWSVTVGSDGKFTGATTYRGYPIFFKEDSIIKIEIDASGAHRLRETKCRGVQAGSDRSVAIINEILYYKSPSGICAYNGSLPSRVSDDLGDTRYYDAVAGAVGDRYYVSMRDDQGEYSLYVFDTKNGIWVKEDNTNAIYFCTHVDELYFVDSRDKMLKSVNGTNLFNFDETVPEDDVEWCVESVPIGYMLPDQKYLSRVSMRVTLNLHSEIDLYVRYDSVGEWKHICNINGKGTKSYSVPFIPTRCDHFQFKISGRGNCKIHSITKTIEEGSEE